MFINISNNSYILFKVTLNRNRNLIKCFTVTHIIHQVLLYSLPVEFSMKYLSMSITPNKSNSNTKVFIMSNLKILSCSHCLKRWLCQLAARRCWQCPLLSHSKSSDQRNEDPWPDIAMQTWIMQRWQGSPKKSRLLWEVHNIWFARLWCEDIS